MCTVRDDLAAITVLAAAIVDATKMVERKCIFRNDYVGEGVDGGFRSTVHNLK